MSSILSGKSHPKSGSSSAVPAVKIEKYAVPTDQLAWRVPAEWLESKPTEVSDSVPIVGQERGLQALRFGLDTDANFHVFIAGFPGTGRQIALNNLLQEKRTAYGPRNDWCYVYNFENPGQPKALGLPPGEGVLLRDVVDETITQLAGNLSALFDSKYFRRQKKKLRKELATEKSLRLAELKEKVLADNFEFEQVDTGAYKRFRLRAVPDGKEFIVNDIPGKRVRLPKDNPERALVKDLHEALREFQRKDKKLGIRLAKLDQELAQPIVDESFAQLKRSFPYPEIKHHFEQMRKLLLERLDVFEPLETLTPISVDVDPLWKLRVNVMVSVTESESVPILYEDSPSLIHVFGALERDNNRGGRSGHPTFLDLHAGSLLQANQGILVIDITGNDEFVEYYELLKKIIKNQEYVIDPNYFYSESPMVTMRPEPIPVQLKVVLIGEDSQYYRLSRMDVEFFTLFNVKAEFDYSTDLTRRNFENYRQYISTHQLIENLLPLSPAAVAVLTEHAVRESGLRTKVSVEMAQMNQVLREAHYWAQTDGGTEIMDEHVHMALNESRARQSLYYEDVLERLVSGRKLLKMSGVAVGEINGLLVFEDGMYEFGQPTRITAVISAGRSGVINIDRDADLSGKSHTKGVAIMKSYLRFLYARQREMHFSASICFEQSYYKIDGDSASLAETLLLISGLGNISLRQDLAITGSLNQFGEVQPIGGLNAKIEGYYDLCHRIGLTGTQGVVMPAINLVNIQLRADVVAAIEQGEFHVYAVHTVDEALEIFTGIPAEKADEKGRFKKDTVHYLVEKELEKLRRADKNDND